MQNLQKEIKGKYPKMVKDKTEKINLIDRMERFSRNHPFIFWGGSLLWIIIPDPIPLIDEILVAVIMSLVGLRKLK